MNEQRAQRVRRAGLFGGLAAAVAASVCCLGPLVLLGLGVSGAWIGALSAFEPYRPFFIALALGLLGFAFYSVYRRPKPEGCGEGSYCANPRAERINKVSLWTVTVLVAAMLAAPSLIGRSFVGAEPTEAGGALKAVTLDVSGMTCGACAVTTRTALENVEGVRSAHVTFEPPQAVVVYEAGRVTVEDLAAATTNAGYPSQVASGG